MGCWYTCAPLLRFPLLQTHMYVHSTSTPSPHVVHEYRRVPVFVINILQAPCQRLVRGQCVSRSSLVTSSSCLNIYQLRRHGRLGVFALKVLLEGFGVRHLCPADRAGMDQCGLSCSLLVSGLAFLLLCCLLGVLLLGLNLLLPASHGPQLRDLTLFTLLSVSFSQIGRAYV